MRVAAALCVWLAAVLGSKRADGATPSWAIAPPRGFASGVLSGGIVSARAEGNLGYGRPFWMASAASASVLATPEFIALFLGMRATLSALEVTFGLRDVASFRRGLPTLRDRFESEDFSLASPKARVSSAVFDAHAAVPLSGGLVIASGSWTRPLDLPQGRAFYDETHRLVVSSRGAALAKAGYLFGIMPDRLRIGPWGELAFAARPGGALVRAGVVGQLRLSDHLDALAGLLVPVRDPDALGVVVGSFGFCFLRYRFATGETASSFEHP